MLLLARQTLRKSSCFAFFDETDRAGITICHTCPEMQLRLPESLKIKWDQIMKDIVEHKIKVKEITLSSQIGKAHVT